MGQFYASLESGHTTASVALQRLVSCTAKNHFYRANRDLGRIFKTEFLLSYLSEPRLRACIDAGFSRSNSSMHWRGISITGGEDESTPANCMRVKFQQRYQMQHRNLRLEGSLLESSNAWLLSPGPRQHPYPLACLQDNRPEF